MSSVRLVRLKTGDKHDVQHGVVTLKADSSIFPERVGVTPNCSVGLRVSGTKTGKKPRNGLLSAFLCFFCTLRKNGHKLCFIHPSLLLHSSVRKKWNWMFCRATPCTSNFPLCQRGPVISPTSKIIFFLRCTHSCLSSYMSSFFAVF